LAKIEEFDLHLKKKVKVLCMLLSQALFCI